MLVSRDSSAANCENWQRLSIEPAEPKRENVFVRFARSMVIDFEKWQNGIGYDLALLRDATPQERNDIERLLIHLGVNDWRDVEALAALATPRAKRALRTALQKPDLSNAIVYYAPELAPKAA